MDYQKELEFAKSMARDAGEIMRSGLNNIERLTKDGSHIVTSVDIEINNMVISRVGQKYPEHGVLGEEASNFNQQHFVWVCDPIDGTKMYAHNIPTSMFSIALTKDGEPVVAIAYNPWTKDIYLSVKGDGATKNGNKIYCENKPLGINGKFAIGNWRSEYSKKFQTLLDEKNFEIIHQYPVVIKGCLVAEGFLNGQIYNHNGAHDIAAVKLIIEEAGGKVTDLDGNEQRYDRKINGAIMSNGVIHDKLLELVKEVK